MAEFVTVARVAQVPENGALAVLAGDIPIALFKLNGVIYALEDTCTHEAYPLSDGELVAGGCVECLYHGAQFDLATGAARALPATTPVRTFPVAIVGDDVRVAL